MLSIEPTGAVLGATVRGIDVTRADERQFAQILLALGQNGVLRFPDQQLDIGDLRRFSERFGQIQGLSAAVEDAAHVGILSNLKEDGKYIGSPDAGQDWHTDMSYRSVMGFVNVLYGIRIPRRNGVPLGGTEFANMHAVYEALPADIRTRLADATATHDFEKFWEHMRRDRASCGRGSPVTLGTKRSEGSDSSFECRFADWRVRRKVLSATRGIDGVASATSSRIGFAEKAFRSFGVVGERCGQQGSAS